MKIIDIILDIVFPSRCIFCHKNEKAICLPCLSSANKAEIAEDKITTIWSYRDPKIKRAIWLLKYRGKKEIGYILAEFAYGYLMEELSELETMRNFKNAIIIPVPLSKIRFKKRGFNQTELICKKFCEINENKNFILEKNALIKIKETKNQAEVKSRIERLKNLEGCFQANEKIVSGKNIIIVDDVTTTGATLREAYRALKQAGAKKILKFALAH